MPVHPIALSQTIFSKRVESSRVSQVLMKSVVHLLHVIKQDTIQYVAHYPVRQRFHAFYGDVVHSELVCLK